MSNKKADINEKKPGFRAFVDFIKQFNLNDIRQLTLFIGSKLFFNFFFGFGIVTVALFCLASGYSYFYQYKPAREQIINIAREVLQDNGQMMVEAYDNFGSEGLEKLRWPGTFRLFNEKLDNLFIKNEFNLPEITTTDDAIKTGILTENKITQNLSKAPLRNNTIAFFKNNKEQIKEFVKGLFIKKKTGTLRIKDENVVGCHFVSAKGNEYVALIYVPQKVPGVENAYTLLKRTKDILPIFIAFCAILCYCMARYVAKPIIEIQNASRKFAMGDFSQKISEKYKKRKDELGELATDFSNMAEKIESGIKSQKRLFNDISHELRSPLARMKIALELLQMKAKEGEQPLISRIEKDIERMNLLIGELLQFSKLENKEIGRASEEIDLEASLKEICSNAEFEGKKENKEVILQIKQPCIIHGVPDLIGRACENVIRNALRFTPENTKVEIVLDKTEKDAIITITDRGPGVPEEEIKRIFAPFYCVEQDRNPQKGGIGLGLSIALRAVQLHNGTIYIANHKEGGLTVTISLPLTAEAD